MAATTTVNPSEDLYYSMSQSSGSILLAASPPSAVL